MLLSGKRIEITWKSSSSEQDDGAKVSQIDRSHITGGSGEGFEVEVEGHNSLCGLLHYNNSVRWLGQPMFTYLNAFLSF